MDIDITGKNIAVTDSLREYVKKKIGKLEKYFNQLFDAHVTLEVEKLDHIAEVTINGDNVVFHAEVSTADMYASIDSLFDKLEKQIRRYKERLIDRTQRAKRAEKNAELEQEEMENDGIQVFEAEDKPMLPSEAILQMDMNRFRFQLFKKGLESVKTPNQFKKHNYAVAYRKKDGDYAVVELNDGKANLNIFSREGEDIKKTDSRPFGINRLSHEDAAQTIRHLNADYYIFQNIDNGELNIIYQTNSGELAVKVPPV